MKKSDNLKRKKQPIPFLNFYYFLLLIYALAVIFGVLHHEPWRDEAQGWLIARDVSFTELFPLLRTEGHPPLWYIVIFPFAKAGAPYMVQNFIAAAFMIGAAYIIIIKTNLHLLVKILIPFSFFFLYGYSVFGRSYCMIAFFVAAIIRTYPKRFEKPWLYALCIVGLFNTHVLTFTFCATLTVLYIWEALRQKIKDRKVIGAAAFMCIGGGYLIPYLYMANRTGEFANGITDHWLQIRRVIDGGITISQHVVVSIVLLLSIAVLLLKRVKAFIILAGGISGVLYILAFKYNMPDLRHEGMIFFVLLTSVAIAMQDNAGKKTKLQMMPQWVLVVIMILQLKPACEQYMADIQQPYSGAQAAAEFLEQQKNTKDKVLVGHQAWAASALLPFLGKDTCMYYGECGCYGTYYVYDSCFINNNWMRPVEFSIDVAYKTFKSKLNDLVFVFNYPANQKGMLFLELIYATPEQTIIPDERYYLYRFKDGLK